MKKDLDNAKALLLQLDYDELVEFFCAVEEELDNRIIEEAELEGLRNVNSSRFWH